MDHPFIIPKDVIVDQNILDKAIEFIDSFNLYEIEHGSELILYFDLKSEAYYFLCHIFGSELIENADMDASLDNDDDDVIYKLNRDLTEDKSAYKLMVQDAELGRTFEDLVVEFDTSYQEDKPLKIYGGQHRIKAISQTINESLNIPHGIRVYFSLTREQKVEIATINNTSIAVSNDLLDRMREQMIGNQLRDWCQTVGILESGRDFADKKDPDIPTVRIARTLLVNYYKGKESSDSDFHQPSICKSGGMDESYQEIRENIDWSDPALRTMGENYTKLHKIQREQVRNRSNDKSAEFARKALSLSVVSSWGYAAGLFQQNDAHLQKHYSLPDTVSGSTDPLGAKNLSKARLKGTDPDTYRGLGTRTGPPELGRMLEVFYLHATRDTKGISLRLANAAIQSYVAKLATNKANKAIGKI